MRQKEVGAIPFIQSEASIALANQNVCFSLKEQERYRSFYYRL